MNGRRTFFRSRTPFLSSGLCQYRKMKERGNGRSIFHLHQRISTGSRYFLPTSWLIVRQLFFEELSWTNPVTVDPVDIPVICTKVNAMRDFCAIRSFQCFHCEHIHSILILISEKLIFKTYITYIETEYTLKQKLKILMCPGKNYLTYNHIFSWTNSGY